MLHVHRLLRGRQLRLVLRDGRGKLVPVEVMRLLVRLLVLFIVCIGDACRQSGAQNGIWTEVIRIESSFMKKS